MLVGAFQALCAPLRFLTGSLALPVVGQGEGAVLSPPFLFPVCVQGYPGLGTFPPRPYVFQAGGRGPLPVSLGHGGLWEWGPVAKPTAQAIGSWRYALLGQHKGARAGHLVPL